MKTHLDHSRNTAIFRKPMACCLASSPWELHADFMHDPPSGEGKATAPAQLQHAPVHPPLLNRRLVMSWHICPSFSLPTLEKVFFSSHCEAVEPVLQRRLDYPHQVPMIHDLDAPLPRRRLAFLHLSPCLVDIVHRPRMHLQRHYRGRIIFAPLLGKLSTAYTGALPSLSQCCAQ